MRLLIVEDDEKAGRYLERGLVEAGHVVDRVGDGPTGLALAGEGIYDAMILDRLLPGLDGIELLRQLRAATNSLPVLLLSALSTARDKATGLQAGADDYLAKPYAFAELTARLEAICRRRQPRGPGDVLGFHTLELNLRQRRASRGARLIALQQKEFTILEILLRHCGQIVTRSMILEAAWPYEFEPRGNIVDMHMHRLRRKVDAEGEIPLIHTVVGAGYILRVD